MVNCSHNDIVRQRIISSVLANLIRQPIIRVLTVIGSVVVARALGPERLAVLAAIGATAVTIRTFFDLGIIKSIGKIVPDISVRFGRNEAVRVLRKLTYLKLSLVSCGFLGLILGNTFGFFEPRRDLFYSKWFFPIVGCNILLQTAIDVKQQEWIAALRMAGLAKLQIAVSLLTPVVVVAAALIFKDPYVVATAQLVPLFFQLCVFSVLPGYDLDLHEETSVRFKLTKIFSEFWRYSSVTYLIFLFNSFVFGLPLTLFLLSTLGVELKAIGNITVTIAIVSIGRQIADIPLSNLRVPILARLVVENDQGRFLHVQRVMVSILVLTSSVMALCMLTLAPLALSLMYGVKYKSAIAWGIPIGVVALFFNVFSLGNSTIRQVERYKPVLIGLLLSLSLVVMSNIFLIPRIRESLWPPLVVLTYVIGRALFLITTDLWTDAVVFRWEGTSVKLRGLLALALALLVAHSILRSVPQQSVLIAAKAFISSGVTFILVFRLLGGIGFEVRNTLSKIILPRFRWLVHVL